MAIEWRNIQVSNPTPYPGENITISGEVWYTERWPWPDEPVKREDIWLVIDAAIIASGKTDGSGRFSFTTRASYVPGPYTYIISLTYPVRTAYMFVGIEVVPEFVCQWCGATFPSKELLETHRAICPYRPAKFPCSWCGAVFATEEALETHKLVCPQRPTVPVEWGKVLLYGSLGLIGIGLAWVAISR